MHQKILVGINSSPGARHALGCTLRYAAEVQAHVVGLLVESPFWKAPRYGKREFESAVQMNAERLARRYSVPFEFRMRRGYPAHTIAEQARLLGCDLVVLGHADSSPLHRRLTASVSDLVRHEAPCRVVVIGTGGVIAIEPELAVTVLADVSSVAAIPLQMT